MLTFNPSVNVSSNHPDESHPLSQRFKNCYFVESFSRHFGLCRSSRYEARLDIFNMFNLWSRSCACFHTCFQRVEAQKWESQIYIRTDGKYTRNSKTSNQSLTVHLHNLVKCNTIKICGWNREKDDRKTNICKPQLIFLLHLLNP